MDPRRVYLRLEGLGSDTGRRSESRSKKARALPIDLQLEVEIKREEEEPGTLR